MAQPTSTSTALPTYFVAHGGGPLPLLDDPSHAKLIQHWKELSKTIEQPKAIVVISAHWEEQEVTITSAENPTLLYDYYGFPPETYQIKYPSPGNPALASHIKELLTQAGIRSHLDPSRGLDHGSFVPLKLIYPKADIPVIQVSLLRSLDPAKHIALGKALAPLRNEGVLLFGSGFNFHNMQAFFSSSSEPMKWSKAFNAYLVDACTKRRGAERDDMLLKWKLAPHARDCHPREEHLLPLLVVAAAAEESPGKAVFQATALNIETLDFRFANDSSDRRAEL